MFLNGSIDDAKERLKALSDIRQLFVRFQRQLYERRELPSSNYVIAGTARDEEQPQGLLCPPLESLPRME